MTRTAGAWHYHLVKAEFEPFVWRAGAGNVHFNDQRPTEPKRFRERVWPVFWRICPKRRTTETWDFRRQPLWHVPYERSMKKAHRVELARRWWTDDPLTRQWYRVDEAVEASRGTRA